MPKLCRRYAIMMAWGLRAPVNIAAPRWRSYVVAAVLTLLGAQPIGAQRDVPTAIALTNASVIDVESGTLASRQTVVIVGEKIIAVGPARNVPVPARAQVIDLAGRYVIPGLWDMHVHRQAGPWFDSLASKPEARAAALTYFNAFFLASGVTGVRDMRADYAQLRWGDESARKAGRPTPRSLVTGQRVGDRPVVAGAPHPIRADSDARAAVAVLRAAGASHVKLGPSLPAPLVRATLDACRQEGMACAGHAPSGVTIQEASAHGLRSLEHLFALPEQTSTISEAQFASWATESAAPSLVQRILYKLRLRVPPPAAEDTAVVTHDPRKAAALFQSLSKSGTWVTPTLTLHAGLTRVSAHDTLSRDERYLIRPLPDDFTQDRRTLAARLLAVQHEGLAQLLVREMKEAGVGLLAGTDTPNHSVPGFSLHGELALLRQAGLTTAEALRTATLEPARYLEATDSLGTICPGRVADLVVLRLNPLDDIRHTRSVEMVVTRGRVLRRTDLDALLAEGVRALAVVRQALGR